MARNGYAWWSVCAALVLTAGRAGAVSGEDVARTCRKHGIAGGLIVHVGCGDGRITATLRPGNSFRVHGLDRDPSAVATAREHLQGLGIYGEVSVAAFDGETLPYADNTVNLLVASGPCRVGEAELLRVLVPRGVAIVGARERSKPRPVETDAWTHFLHGAGGNAVSGDRRVGPPRYLQWDGEPRWSRSHETDMSLTALVTAGGRVFHTTDDGPIGIHETPLAARRFPDRCALVARDAFNGIVLWKRPLPGWGSKAWDGDRWAWGKRDQVFSTPLALPRRLVAAGERLYVTLGFRSPLSELDAQTGRTLRTFDATRNTEEIVLSGGVLVLRVRPAGKEKGEAVVALDAVSGDVLWKRPADALADLTLAAAAGRVCFHDTKRLVALDARTGRELWTAPTPSKPARPLTAGTLVMASDVVLFAGTGGRGGRGGQFVLHAFSAADGKRLWGMPMRGSFRGMPDVFVVGGLAWVGTLTTRGLDLRTGRPVRQVDAPHLFTGGHHVRCYRGKATCRYLISSKRGAEFLDLAGDDHSRHDWVRGTCRYGLLPANGLLYAPPHSCFCFPGVKIAGFNALAADQTPPDPNRPLPPRRTKGPAFGREIASPDPSPADWPTYRHDNARSGHVPASVPVGLQRAWRTALRGRTSPPVAVGERVFVAGRDTHTVRSLDAANGAERWCFTAGGPVDSPPTVHEGRALFGCTDGYVYCLDAADGELVWRFRAAPREKRIVSYGRVESAWPVHGSVLVEKGVAYFAAGRSSFLDGGIYLFGLDPATGEVRHRAHLDGPHPRLDKPSTRAHEMDGALNDILVSNGEKLFLTQNVFDLALRPLDAPVIARHGARKTDLHLVATGGFLDDSGFDRLFWMHARRWPGLYVAIGAPKAGQILAFNDTTTFGLHAFDTKFSRSPYFHPGTGGGELFAADNDNEPTLDARNARAERGTMTRTRPPKWSVRVPVRARAMVLAGQTLFFAGPPDVVDPADPLGAFEGRKGARLWAVSAADGRKLAEHPLDTPPVFDGLIAARGALFLTTEDGAVHCYRP